MVEHEEEGHAAPQSLKAFLGLDYVNELSLHVYSVLSLVYETRCRHTSCQNQISEVL